MQISLEPVRLDTQDGDGEAVLVFRDGRLVAVASRLSDFHGRLSGSLFIEAVFGPRDHHLGVTFASEEELCRWAEFLGDGPPAHHMAPLIQTRRS